MASRREPRTDRRRRAADDGHRRTADGSGHGQPWHDDPVDEALAELERGQKHQWLVAAVLILAIVASLGLVVVDEGFAATAAPWAAVGFLGVAVLFGLSVIARARRTRRAVRALVRERERAAALVARTRSMEAVHAAVREVVAATDLVDVFARVIDAVRDLSRASTAVVLLRGDDELTVAAADGADPPPVGTVIARDDGPAWAAIEAGDLVLAGGAEAAGGGPPGSVLAVPLVLPERIVGALVVERRSRGFTPLDQLTVELFAEHAALAVRNASRIDAREQAADDAIAAASERAREVTARADELRSPIATIAGYTELLLRRGDRFTAERRAGVLRDVQAELERSRDLVDALVRAAAGEPIAVGADAGDGGDVAPTDVAPTDVAPTDAEPAVTDASDAGR